MSPVSTSQYNDDPTFINVALTELESRRQSSQEAVPAAGHINDSRLVSMICGDPFAGTLLAYDVATQRTAANDDVALCVWSYAELDQLPRGTLYGLPRDGLRDA